jgi:glycosyltransferase involved in cell wall biosynthesis
MPNHNGSGYLDEAIKSVLGQTYSNIELIVIDDGSSDSSLEILNEFQSQIFLISTANNGASAARNTGIKKANGILIAFIDSDDVWEPDKLSKQVFKLIDENLDLVYCSGRGFGDGLENPKFYEAVYSGYCYSAFADNPAVAIITLGCSTALFKKEILSISGLFDEDFKGPAEDWDFFRRVSRHANIGFIPEELVKYRIHDKNVSRSSVINYFSGNKRAISKMLMEDKQIKKYNVWLKFYWSFLKESIKSRNLKLLSHLLLSIFKNRK